MSEEELLKKYGCNSLSEFIDTYLDCETAFDLLRSQFKKIKELKLERDTAIFVAKKRLDEIERTKNQKEIFELKYLKADNIINQLEKWLKDEREATVFDYRFAIGDVLDKLQELKGVDKE